MAEDFGVADRGSFYDPVGALQDVVVNHLMQVVAATAMEPPSGRDQRSVKDAMFALFSAMPPGDPAEYVRGQYEGYKSVKGVAKRSSTETYAAMRLEIDNWRWSGVPFFIRAGKTLAVTQWEMRLIFKEPPRLGFASRRSGRPQPDELVIRLYPTTGIRLLVDAQRADNPEPERVNLDMEFADEGGEGPAPYEVLLHAALVGDSTRFTRQDNIEETWRIMAPLIEKPPRIHPYKRRSWGPSAANRLVADYGGWREPWLPA
jgi:glucose-6-phosphate 1-dehydrogenase